jgi:alpha-galactosidase
MFAVFPVTMVFLAMGNNPAEDWLNNRFSAGTPPPFSFKYGGRPSSRFITGWRSQHSAQQLDGSRTEHTFTYTDPQTKLEVRAECLLFSDFPAVEWVLKFTNNGAEDTPIIESVQALDAIFAASASSETVLHRALGSNAARTDFAPVDEVVRPGAPVQLATVGGRSSNTNALPFFNLDFEGNEGVIIAVGWSGQWAASFAKQESSGVEVKAGMELTHLTLRPGEQIRTPRILLLFWSGDDYLAGQNLFRRFIIAHHMPHHNGQPVTLPFACCASQLYEESNKATEENQLDFAKRFQQFGVEYFWIDAGWFEGRWPNGVGNWSVRKDGFPRGLRPVSDAVRKMGMGFVLWFEPERVFQGTWIDREHPEWVLRLPDNPNGLLDLGNEQARQWLTDHISGMIESEGITVYRQDFNMDPLPFWRAADEPDRQGMTEIRHLEGLYTFWDELLRRHPALIIDNCASGGRRIDLETISRSVALWRTDYQYFEPNGYQSHTYGISLWLPSTSTGSGNPDTYAFRSSMNNGLNIGWNPYLPEVPVERAKALTSEFKRLRHFFFGDFYPLTSHSVTDDTWIAYQFHRPDERAGMVLAFRRPECPTESLRVRLRGLTPSARYEVSFEDAAVKQTLTGKELGEGFELTAPAPRMAILVTYRES